MRGAGHYVFVGREGKRFKDTKTGFNATLRRAGIKDFRFHDLRHTFASHLVMGGVDLATIKDLLGHKDFKMTLRYAHLAPAHKTAALAILDGTFNGHPNCTITAQSKEKGLSVTDNPLKKLVGHEGFEPSTS